MAALLTEWFQCPLQMKLPQALSVYLRFYSVCQDGHLQFYDIITNSSQYLDMLSTMAEI